MFTRVLGGIGRAMIAAGVLLLLFVAYQLWGTSYRTTVAQNGLNDGFQQQLERVKKNQTPVERANVVSAAGPSSTDAAGADDPGISAPGTTRPRGTTTTRSPDDTTPKGPGDENDENLGEKQAFRYAKGEGIAQINIPAIGSDFTIIEGVDLPLLTEGPGHFPGTAFPGQAGNVGLAGHRVTYKAPFNRIDELQPGDKIEVTTVQGKFTYEIQAQPDGTGHFIVDPSDTSILEDKGDNRITLVACHPKYDLKQRIIVTGKLVGNAADGSYKGSADSLSLPGADGGNDFSGAGSADVLAGNDSSARLPAILLSLAALAVWFLAYLLGRWWKKWPAYLVMAPVFFLLLWFAFDFINRSLPAAY